MKFLAAVIVMNLLSLMGFAQGKYFESFDGTRIYYEVAGKGDPVLLVHGFIVNSSSWKKTALYQALIDAGYKVIIVDLRGNGKSDKPHDIAAYQKDAEARDLMGLISALGIKHYAAVGYSRGSIIVSRLMVKDKRLNAAVLGGMGPDFTDPEWPRRKEFYAALSGEDVPDLKEMVNYVKESGLDQQALACMQGAQPSTSKRELAGVSIPVLVVNGDHDSANGSSEDLAALIPGARHVFVPGEHNDAVRTDEFGAAILSFLKDAK